MRDVIVMMEDSQDIKSKSFLDFKKNFKSVVVDGIKYYIVECDILLDENELYAYFLRQKNRMESTSVEEESNNQEDNRQSS